MLKLEITMESQIGDRKHYIRRSFPAEKGVYELSNYGYPYNKYRKFEIYYLIGMPSEIRL